VTVLLAGGQCVVERGGRYDVRQLSVLIAGGRIAALGDEADRQAAATGADVVDAHERLIVPGLVNMHTHCSQSLQRGSVPAAPLEVWLLDVSFNLGVLTPRDHYVAALLASIERLRTGTTALMNLAIFGPVPDEDVIGATFEAYADAGIRATVALGYTDLSYTDCLPWHEELITDAQRRPGPPRSAADRDALFDLVDRVRTEWHGAAEDRLRVALGPSQPQRCSPELLERTGAYAARHDLAIHTHLLESRAQVMMTRTGAWPSFIEYLDDAGCLSDRTSLAHAIWLDRAELDRVRERGAWLVHNPIGNLRLGDGIAPVARYLKSGANVALGTDGSCSSGSVSMLDSLHLAAVLGATGTADHSDWLDEHDVLRMATRSGAAAMQVQDLGTVERGARADLVLYDLTDLPFIPRNDPLEQLVFGGHRAIVDRVYVGGELVVRDGHLTRVNEADIFAEANEIAAKLRRDLPNVRARAADLRPAVERISRRAHEEVGHGRSNLLWSVPSSNG
jgi:5-methylthioadenosine/S-adenosylhomocysteine deaminase